MTGQRDYALELDPGEVERYRMMAEQARAAEADLWDLAGIGPGASVADVGCGPGAMLPALSAAVGAEGRVQAVDADPEAVAAATALVAAAGLGNVSVAQARADHTGLAPGSLDVAMVRHVLAHNGGAEDAIVAHLATLVRPGGCLYLVDSDGTAFRTLPEHADLTDLNDALRGLPGGQGGRQPGRPAAGRPRGQGRPGAARVQRPLLHRPAPGGDPRTVLGGPGGDGRGRRGHRGRRPPLGPGVPGGRGGPGAADGLRPLFTAIGRRPA